MNENIRLGNERLLKLAQATREALPENFDMERHVHPCGTPACAFGHYAARSDLQDQFAINTRSEPDRFRNEGVHIVTSFEPLVAGYTDPRVLEHFAITEEEANELFGAASDYSEEEHVSYALLARMCSTPKEAAAYIENFVRQRS